MKQSESKINVIQNHIALFIQLLPSVSMLRLSQATWRYFVH